MIIGITGRSGDGKTTVAQLLNKKIPKSKIIEVDDYNIPIFLKSPQLIELYGPEIIKDDFINIDLFLENFDGFKKIHEITNEETEAYSLELIKEEQKKFDTIIIDWVRLPSLENVWKMCDYHILVESSNKEKRYANLYSRLKDCSCSPKGMDDELYKRDRGNLDFHSYSYDFKVVNEYDDTLKSIVDEIARKISKSN